MAVILIVNGTYLYVITELQLATTYKAFLQLSLSLFNIFWNTVVVKLLFKIFPENFSNKYVVNIHVFMLAFNAIAAPIATTLVTEKNCLNGFFVYSDHIKTASSLVYCNGISLTNDVSFKCIEYTTVFLETDFLPPFMYSYSCYNSFLKDYIPVFMYTQILLLFIPIIVIYISLTLISKSSDEPLPFWTQFAPHILFPTREKYNDNQKLFVPTSIMSIILTNLLLLITFGVMCPTLAFLVALNMILLTVIWQILIGRFLQLYTLQDGLSDGNFSVYSNAERMTKEFEIFCLHVWEGPMSSMWSIVYIAVILHMFIFIDMTLEEKGTVMTMFLVVIPIVTCTILLRFLLNKRYVDSILQYLGFQHMKSNANEFHTTDINNSRSISSSVMDEESINEATNMNKRLMSNSRLISTASTMSTFSIQM
jgi:hypothetical protein